MVSGDAGSATSTATVTAASVGSPTATGSATVKTIAVAVNTLVVDDDAFVPSGSPNVDVNKSYTDALTSAGVSFQLWDLGVDKNLPLNYLKSFNNVVWFTGNSYPSPLGPYENELKSFLDGGGNLFVSGQDLLDQAAGTTTFVHNYLHVTWDGSENQNDRRTNSVTSVAGNPVTNGIGTVPLDLSVLGGANLAFMDQITPNGGALAAFLDDGSSTKPAVGTGPQPDALTYRGTYKVVFLAFPFEEYGTASQKSDLMSRVFSFFAS